VDAHEVIAGHLFEVGRFVRDSKQQRLRAYPDTSVGMVAGLAMIGSGCHVKDLAGRTGLDPSTVSRAVAAMVSHGLVQRCADPDDRRASVLELTDAGQAALDEARDWFLGFLRTALASWTPADVAALGDLLGRFLADAIAQRDRETAR
jgi:DNA-binding MarR family transcriptional regulator